jgi:prephenate dehydrogenase
MRVFVWGMGLIGASLALRLKAHGYNVSGAVLSDRSRDVLLQRGFENIYVNEAEAIEALHAADILVLGTGVTECCRILDLVYADPQLRRHLTVFDLCSTKEQICAHASRYGAEARFIGCHPMAGKELQGPQAAESTLFEGASIFLTPLSTASATVNADLVAQVTSLWDATGAHTCVTNPADHDKTMAYVSHGLHLNSCLIARMSETIVSIAPPLSPAAGSYRDMTRIVQSSGAMWQEISESNRTNIVAWLRQLSSEAANLADKLEDGDSQISQLFDEARVAREQLMQR